MNLTPDTLYSVALKLDGGELMKMCSTNNETRRICTSERFNPIWTQKLLTEFNVKYEGNNAYMEYLQNAYLYKQRYWVATIFNKNDNQITQSKIFKNHSDAAVYLGNEAMKYKIHNPNFTQPKYISYIATIKELGSFEDMWNKYEITESEFETKSQETVNYTNYISSLRNLFNIIKSLSSETLEEKDFNHFRMEFEIIISEEDIEDEEYESVWERFREEILPSYVDEKQLNNKDIKTALMKLLNLKNVYGDSKEEEEEEEE